MEAMFGRRVIERGKLQYSALLFPEDVLGHRQLSSTLLSLIKTSPFLAQRMCENFDYYEHGSNKTVQVGVDDLYDLTGGKRMFFGKNTVVLDMASGVGRAVRQFSGHQNVIIGMDIRYRHESPENTKKGNYVSGNWKYLPFGSNSFSGIMSCEGFPRWEEPENFPQVIADTTRVCKRNAIWRATFRPSLTLNKSENFQEANDMKELSGLLNNNGWDVCIRPRLFIAKLAEK